MVFLWYYKKAVGEQLLSAIENEPTAYGKVHALFENAMMSQSKGCLMVNTGVALSLHDQIIAEIVQVNFQEIEKVLNRIIHQGQIDKEISPSIDSEISARTIHNALICIRVQLKTTDDISKLQPINDMTLSVLLKDEKRGKYESSTDYQICEGR